MNTYVIGDIQGCADELARLLDALRFDAARDRLWLVGDLINRGPHSLQTLRLARELGGRCIAVLGNHDLSILAQLLGDNPGRRPGRTARRLADAPDAAELIHWLRCRPLAHRDQGCLMIHAGLPPQWTATEAMAHAAEVEAALRGPDHARFLGAMYGDKPVLWDEGLAGMARLRFIVNCLTRLRFCDGAGRLVLKEKGRPGQAPPGLSPWFALPGRRSRDETIVFGHWSTLGQVYWPACNVWGLDTGCVWGGRLTALHLEGQRLVQAPGAGHKKPGGG